MLCIFDVLVGSSSGERKHDVIDVVRNLTSSKISAAVILKFRVSLQSRKVVGYGRTGHRALAG